jgi:Cdc6-like AAA superfamily ATPase
MPRAPSRLPVRRAYFLQCINVTFRRYISGVPGTGKTATVHTAGAAAAAAAAAAVMVVVAAVVVLIALATVRRLKESAKLQGHKQPLFVEINGQRLPTPHHLYTGKTIETSNP